MALVAMDSRTRIARSVLIVDHHEGLGAVTGTALILLGETAEGTMTEFAIARKVWAGLALFFLSTATCTASPFADWAAVVVAGDWHSHGGGPSEAFDNARRDVSFDLERMGFQPQNVEQFSVRPGNYPLEHPAASDAHTIATSLWDLSNRTSTGCFIYFTSHGSPDGIVMGDSTYAPSSMSQMLDNTCSDRLTVVVISACFSGVFVPALEAPNRMILTAARPDRTSFGCGQTDRYPYFDQCVLETLPASTDFPDFGHSVQNCVAAREKREHMAPPSEPQLWIGAAAAASLPKW